MPPVDDIPPIVVVPVPPTLDAPLVVALVTPLTEDEVEAALDELALTLDEPEVVLEGPALVPDEPALVLESVIPSAMFSVAGSPLSVPHAARTTLDEKSINADRARWIRPRVGAAAAVTRVR